MVEEPKTSYTYKYVSYLHTRDPLIAKVHFKYEK